MRLSLPTTFPFSGLSLYLNIKNLLT